MFCLHKERRKKLATTVWVLVLFVPLFSQEYYHGRLLSSTIPIVEHLDAPEVVVHSSPKATNSDGLCRTIPRRNENGLIVFFLHIPKTGGSTLQTILRESVDHYYNGWTMQGYQKSVKAMDLALDKWDNKTHCMELHSANAPPFVTALEKVQSWKQRCQALNIPFFAFTIMREPISLSFSFFQFYHSGVHRKFQTIRNATEEEFLHHTLHNPQCLFLTRSEMSFMPQVRAESLGLSEKECEAALSGMTFTLDWVGTTETLSTETLPLLSTVLQSPLDATKRENTSPSKNFQIHQLSEAGLQQLQQWNRLDAAMYNRTTRHFSGLYEQRFQQCVANQSAAVLGTRYS